MAEYGILQRLDVIGDPGKFCVRDRRKLAERKPDPHNERDDEAKNKRTECRKYEYRHVTFYGLFHKKPSFQKSGVGNEYPRRFLSSINLLL